MYRVSFLKTVSRSVCLSGCFYGAFSDSAFAHSCNITPPTVSLGTIEGALSRPSRTATYLTLHCTSLSKATPTKFCITLGNTGQDGAVYPGYRVLKNNNGNQYIPFNFVKSDTNTILGGEPGGYGVPLTGTTGDETGKRDFMIPFDALVGQLDGMQIAPGAYSGQFNLILKFNYRSNGPAPEDLCSVQSSGGGTTVRPGQRITVTATAKTSCSLSAPGEIAFGKAAELASVRPTEGKINVKCNMNTSYQIGLGNLNANGKRAMQCATPNSCGTAAVLYNLYQDAAHTQIWDNKWGTSGTLKGIAAETGSKDYPVYAKIEPGQPRPPAGSYADIVTVELRIDNPGA